MATRRARALLYRRATTSAAFRYLSDLRSTRIALRFDETMLVLSTPHLSDDYKGRPSYFLARRRTFSGIVLLIRLKSRKSQSRSRSNSTRSAKSFEPSQKSSASTVT
jgi:hypothetical protein